MAKLIFDHSEDVPQEELPDALNKGYALIAEELPRRATPETIVNTRVRLERVSDRNILTVRIYDSQAIDWTKVIIRGVLLAVLIFLLYHFG